MDTTRMRTWAEIDLTALEHNYRTLRAMLPRECRFLGLCKANAYGHGAAVIGHTLERLGADMLAVACVSEAGGAAAERGQAAHSLLGRDPGGS